MKTEERTRVSIFPDSQRLGATGLVNALTKEVGLAEAHNQIQISGWSPSIYKKNYRNKKNFLEAFFIAVDIDEGLTIKEAEVILRKYNLQYSITCTRNHKKTKGMSPVCDRFRIVLLLKEAIITQKSHEQTMDFLKKYIFPQMDPQCLDSSRAYFASSSDLNENDSVLNLTGKSFAMNDIEISAIDLALSNYDLPAQSIFFLNNPEEVAANSEWNGNLNTLCFCLATQGALEPEVIEICNEIALSELDDKDLATIQSGMKSGRQKYLANGDNSESSGIEVLYKIIRSEMSKYHIIYRENYERTILRENDNREVTVISKKVLIDSLTQKVSDLKKFKSIPQIKNLAEYFISMSEAIPDPPLISFSNDEGLSYVKIDYPNSDKDCPIFKEFLSRCSNSDSIAAFIWSIFECKSNTHQYLWLFGDGQDGKGSLLEFLQRLLKHTFCVADSHGIKNNSFYTSLFVGKRLIAYPDNSSRYLPTTDVIKSLTGGDTIYTNTWS